MKKRIYEKTLKTLNNNTIQVQSSAFIDLKYCNHLRYMKDSMVDSTCDKRVKRKQIPEDIPLKKVNFAW